MLEGLYSAAAGMAADQQQIDSISNDIANVNTSGYKSLRTGFRDLLYTQQAAGTGGDDLIGAGAAATIIGADQSEGALSQTNNPLDVAVQGSGYIQVKRADGTIGLTRNGALSLDADRRLTANDGDLLQPPVTVPAGVDPEQIQISSDGTLSAGGKSFGKIALVNVPAPNSLLSDGTGLLTATKGSGAIATDSSTTLTQGALETSNVDLDADMTNMMSTQRSYQLASQAIQIQDQMAQIANELRQ